MINGLIFWDERMSYFKKKTHTNLMLTRNKKELINKIFFLNNYFQTPTVPRKPLFLQRNIRKFKVQKSTTETIELDEEKTGDDGKILLDTITSITTTTTTTNSTTITEEMTSNDPIWGKRMPERLGASANDTILLDDKTEVKLNVNSYKMVFLANKDSLFYRRNSLKKAKQVSF